jgi:hypothetical protein
VSEPEEWRPIAGFPGYSVSSEGRVCSDARGVLVQIPEPKMGYLRVRMMDPSRKRCTVLIHRLVVKAFGDVPEGRWITRHLDGDHRNNRATNLRAGTYSENEHDIVRHGRHYEANRTHCPQGHPYDEANTYVPRYKKCRACRICRAEANARYEARNPDRHKRRR